MGKVYAGKFSGKGKRFGIVVARFNEFITQRLLDSATDFLLRSEVKPKDIEVAWVPGAFEIPVAALKMAKTKRYDAVITLGCVIKGQTDHYEHVTNAVATGVETAAVRTEVPILLGVITCSSLEQAIDRAGAKLGNKGAQTAQAAIEMANLHESISTV